MECLNKAISLDPQHIFALCNKGLTFDYQHNGDEAAQCYQKAKEVNDSKTQAWFRAIDKKHQIICSLFGLKLSPSPVQM